MQNYFMKTIISVFEFKHLISQTPGLDIFKMWSTVVYHFCIFKIDGDIAKFVKISIYLKIKIVSISYIFVNVKDTRNVDHFMKRL